MKRLSVLAACTFVTALACGAPAPGQQESGRAAATTAATRGEALYRYHCATCHGEGPRQPGTKALEIKYKGEVPAVLHKRTDLEADMVKVVVRSGMGSMPFFRKTGISDAELDTLAAHLAKK